MTTGLPGRPAGGWLGFAASLAGLASQAAPSCEPVPASKTIFCYYRFLILTWLHALTIILIQYSLVAQIIVFL